MLSTIRDFLSPISGYISIGLLVLFLATCGGFYFYYHSTQAKLTENATTIANQNITIANQKLAIDQLQKDAKLGVSIRNDLADKADAANAQASKLADSLVKLQATIDAKPGLVEIAINNGTKLRNRCFELASGSPVILNEKNSVCPQLVGVK